MASVYTTQRGKNKKAKAKDHTLSNSMRASVKLTPTAPPAHKLFEATLFGEPAARIGSSVHREKLQKERDMRAAAESGCSAGRLCARPSPADTAFLAEAVAAISLDGSDGHDRGSGSHAGSGDAADVAGAGSAAAAAAATTTTKSTTSTSLKKCACGHAAYCGPACQKVHWSEHKAFCVAKRAELAEVADYEAKAKAAAEARAKAAVAELLFEER